jgi:hypothetical protein
VLQWDHIRDITSAAFGFGVNEAAGRQVLFLVACALGVISNSSIPSWARVSTPPQRMTR